MRRLNGCSQGFKYVPVPDWSDDNVLAADRQRNYRFRDAGLARSAINE
jgi:hypothetical protein